MTWCARCVYEASRRVRVHGLAGEKLQMGRAGEIHVWKGGRRLVGKARASAPPAAFGTTIGPRPPALQHFFATRLVPAGNEIPPANALVRISSL